VIHGDAQQLLDQLPRASIDLFLPVHPTPMRERTAVFTRIVMSSGFCHSGEACSMLPSPAEA
jgi:hypothetical protein